jgi:Sigma-70, region 4
MRLKRANAGIRFWGSAVLYSAAELLSKEIRKLPPTLRAPLQLCSVRGLSAADTCQVLGIGHPALKGRIFRARHKLAYALRSTMRVDRMNPKGISGARHETGCQGVLIGVAQKTSCTSVFPLSRRPTGCLLQTFQRACAFSKKLQNALASIICRGLLHSISNRAGLATRTAIHRAREIATFNRLEL